MGQAGHDVRRRRRGARLDAVACCSTRWARCRRNTTRRRKKPRAPIDKNRDGFVISGGGGIVVLEELEHAKARGAKIYARAGRLWRDRRRRRHGGAVGRRRGALHADGARRTSKAPVDYINPHAHFDAGRRHSRDQRDPRSVRRAKCRRSAPPSRSPATARARPACTKRSTRFCMMQARLHRRKRQYRRTRSGGRRRADRPQAGSTTPRSTSPCPTASASAAPMRRWCSSVMRHETRIVFAA